MALHTQIVADGEPLSLNWGMWHVMRMQEVAITEELGLQYGAPEFWVRFHETTLAKKGEYVVQRNHHFRDEADGETLSILAGYVLRMSYS